MKKTFFVNLIRNIKKTFSRFISIVIIIAIGVAFYSGVRATSPDMKKSGDLYFRQNNFMDFRVISTLGLTGDDLNAISKLSGVKKAEGSYSIDAVTEKNKHQMVLNVNSLPDKNGVNKISIVEGRTAKYDNEIVVEDRFLKENKLKLGDKIELESGNDSKIEDRLKNSKFKIVGTADSPLYISSQRQLSSLGNGTVKGFVYILPEVFKSNAFTEIDIETDLNESENSLLNNEKYKNESANLEKRLKNLGITRNKIRYDEILKQMQYSKKNIKEPEWYVLGRSTNIGYENYLQDSERIDNIGKAFPLIFFLVAALVSLTTITRIVQENRTEIGTFKALGYSKVSIIAHYLIYSMAASVTGSIIGILTGFKLFPPLIINAYSTLYTLPKSIYQFDSKLASEAALISIIVTALAAVLSAAEEMTEVPASLMRPKPPKAGKGILLEKIPFIWRRLNFSKKVAARNIFRYKQRFFMTVIGIAACTGLMITGFGLKGEIIGASEKQFSNIYKYDMQSVLKKNSDEEQKNIIKGKLLANQNIKSVLFFYSKNASVQKSKSVEEDVYVIIPENNTGLKKYVNLTWRGRTLKLGDNGVIITEKLSKLMNKKIGDTIEFKLNGKILKAKIAAITEQYVQHYIYISNEYYKAIEGENAEYNSFYGIIRSTSVTSENNIAKYMTGIENINSVSFKNNVHIDFNKSIQSINSVVAILVISAGVLAFVVIYNLTNININERKRELATIKLLGFYDKELALYIYRENILLTVIGSLVGIPIGILLNNFVISTAETDITLFLKNIEPLCFLYSILLTLLFSFIVNLIMYGEFSRIDMIESLKSAE